TRTRCGGGNTDMEPVSRGARLHLVSHRRGALLADESAIDEPGQVERSDEIRRPLRGDELGNRLPRCRTGLEAVRAPPDVHVESFDRGDAHDGRVVRRQVAESGPLPA